MSRNQFIAQSNSIHSISFAELILFCVVVKQVIIEESWCKFFISPSWNRRSRPQKRAFHFVSLNPASSHCCPLWFRGQPSFFLCYLILTVPPLVRGADDLAFGTGTAWHQPQSKLPPMFAPSRSGGRSNTRPRNFCPLLFGGHNNECLPENEV